MTQPMRNVENVYPLTPRQRDVLTAPDDGRHRGQLAWTMHRVAEPGIVAAAFGDAVARHPVLRTGIFTEGLPEPLQVVRIEAALPWAETDLSHLSASEQETALDALSAEERGRGFPSATAPLARMVAVRLAPDSYRFVWTYSSLVLDDRSAALVLDEVLDGLRGGHAPAARPPAPPALFAWLQRQDAERAAGYWRTALDGAAPPPAAPSGEPVRRTHRTVLPPAAAERLRTALQQHRLDWDAAAAAAWALLLHARAGETDVVVGLAIAGRPPALARSEAMVGPARGVLPFRLSVSPDEPLRDLLRRAREAREALRDFEHVSEGEVREWVDAAPDAPLAETLVEAADAPGARAGAWQVRQVPAWAGRAMELRLSVGEEVAVRLDFDARRLDPARAPAVLAAFRTVLEAVADAPERPVGALAAAAAEAWDGGASVRGGDTAAEVEAVLAAHPAVASVRVEADGEGVRARIVPAPGAVERDRTRRGLRFSLFYFADAADDADREKYRLLLEGGTFADRNGFEAVWLPERHFHENGGLYPNPSVLAAALAPMTSRVHLRSGSVALPLHHPLRVAEEWSVVDNLSGGRVGLSVTSGWIPNDFALAPDNYASKRDVMFRMLEEVRELWRGGTIAVRDGAGNDTSLRIFPRPLQPELPVWLTCSGDPAVFARAGEMGVHCLTALLTQPLETAAEKVALYREAREGAGLDPAAGQVTLMLHTFVGTEVDEVLARVRGPLTTYLRSHIGLMETMVESLNLKVDINEPQWLDSLATFAFERYYRTGAFIGTPESCIPMVDRVVAAGVDEVACLIDFGVDADAVLAALTSLATLRRLCEEGAELGPLALDRWLRRRIPDLRAPVRFDVEADAPAGGPPADAAVHAEPGVPA